MSSDQLTLRAETGRATGSRASRRIRREGGVPAVVYGRGADPVSITVDHHDLVAILAEGGSNAIISLEVDGETHVTMPKVVERHPFRNLIRHVDFFKISLTETTTVDVSISLQGVPAGAAEGGVLSVVQGTVSIVALPTAIPGEIEVDVSALGVGDSLRVEQLPEIEGVEFLDEPDTVLATVSVPRAVVEEEVVEGEEEMVEGEEEAAGDAGEAEAAAEEDAGE